MIRNRTNLCAALAILGAGTALFAAPPTDEQVERAIEAYDAAMAEQKPSTFPEVQKIAGDALGDMSVEEMSARQIGTIVSHAPILQYAQVYPKAQERLRSFAEDRGEDGAIAAAILFSDDFRAAKEDSAKVDLIKKTLGHPAFEAAVGLGVTNNVFSALGSVSPAVAEQTRAEILSLERFLQSKYADKMARAYVEYLKAYTAASDTPAEVKRVRERMAALAAEAAAKTEDERLAKFYRGVSSYLNGAFARGELVGFQAPEVTINWSSDPSLSSIGALRGEVVVLDFWATWCGPCVASFPKVRELVERYEGYPVRIIGVTSLQGAHYDSEAAEKKVDTTDDPAQEYELMASYMKSRDITWSVVFTAQDAFNPDFGVRGIPHVAIIGPDGKVRHNGLHPARPLKEKAELIDKLLNDAGLPCPPPVEETEDGDQG